VEAKAKAEDEDEKGVEDAEEQAQEQEEEEKAVAGEEEEDEVTPAQTLLFERKNYLLVEDPPLYLGDDMIKAWIADQPSLQITHFYWANGPSGCALLECSPENPSIPQSITIKNKQFKVTHSSTSLPNILGAATSVARMQMWTKSSTITTAPLLPRATSLCVRRPQSNARALHFSRERYTSPCSMVWCSARSTGC